MATATRSSVASGDKRSPVDIMRSLRDKDCINFLEKPPTQMQTFMCGLVTFDNETQPASPVELLQMGRTPPTPNGGPWWNHPPVVPKWAQQKYCQEFSVLISLKHCGICVILKCCVVYLWKCCVLVFTSVSLHCISHQ